MKSCGITERADIDLGLVTDDAFASDKNYLDSAVIEFVFDLGRMSIC